MAGTVGLEPTLTWLTARRLYQLGYVPSNGGDRPDRSRPSIHGQTCSHVPRTLAALTSTAQGVSPSRSTRSCGVPSRRFAPMLAYMIHDSSIQGIPDWPSGGGRAPRLDGPHPVRERIRVGDDVG